MINVHDTIPSPPPIETIPDTIPNNPLPEITEVDNPLPEDCESTAVTITSPNFNVPLIMLLITAAATLLHMFYCCH
jgi:hypothetical protein